MFSVIFPGQGSQFIGMAKDFYDNFKYVRDYFPQNDRNLLKNSKELIDGCNENEIQFISKSRKYIGFFEKFFKLFS